MKMLTNLGDGQLISSFVLGFAVLFSPGACVEVVAVAVQFAWQEDETISSGWFEGFFNVVIPVASKCISNNVL